MNKKGRGWFRLRGTSKMPNGLTVGVFLFLLIGLGVGFAGKAEASLADHVVINEISIEGVASAGGEFDDWVELYNPTTASTSLSGWSIQKTNASGVSLYRKALTGVIPAGGYYLIVRDNASTTQSLKDLANVLAAGSVSGFALTNDNIIYLVNNNVDVSSSTDPSHIIDLVGFGTATIYEGAPALNPTAGKSLARKLDGEDSNNNNLDFAIADSPTPKSGAVSSGDDDIGGTVLLTITPDTTPVQNINSTEAQIVFQVNATGTAFIKYGLDSSYASTTAPETVSENVTKTINLAGLSCATTYHYVIYAENAGATENDTTGDAVFTTLPCGITLDSLVMTKSSARANNQYNDGWQWEFNITVWNMNETSLKMKFNQWTGGTTLNAGANMQYSADNGAVWRDITANAAYPAVGADLSGIDNGVTAGRQVKIIVRMKVPVGTGAGYYSSSYGILTE